MNLCVAHVDSDLCTVAILTVGCDAQHWCMMPTDANGNYSLLIFVTGKSKE